jgi:chromosome partitioning protein
MPIIRGAAMADDAVTIKKSRSRKVKDAPVPVAAPDELVKTPRKLLISGSKGGIGKTGCSRIVGVAASLEGLRVALVDTDDQRSLSAWHTLRDESGYEGLAKLDCFAMDISTAPDEIEKLTGYDLVIIDTPNAVQAYREAVIRLIALADFVLLPTGMTFDDRRSAIPWMAVMKHYGKEAAFVMNRVKRGTIAFRDAKKLLLKEGRLCPVDIPDLEHIHSFADQGLSAVDIDNAKGRDDCIGLWHFVRNEMRL